MSAHRGGRRRRRTKRGRRQARCRFCVIGFGVRAPAVERPPNESTFPPLDSVREAGARTDTRSPTAMLIATFRYAAPARCGASANERRIVAGDEGGAQSTSKHEWGEAVVRAGRRRTRVSRSSGRRRVLPLDPVREANACSSPHSVSAAPVRCGAFADERRGVAGGGGGWVRTRSARPAPSDLKVQERPAHVPPLVTPSHVTR
jgi:hypothetical protein